MDADRIVKKNDMKKEVEESIIEERRKRQVIAFNLKQGEVNNYRGLVWNMIEITGVRVRSEDVSDMIWIMKKYRDEVVKPGIIEFNDEHDKLTMLKNKSDLIEMEEYTSF